MTKWKCPGEQKQVTVSAGREERIEIQERGIVGVKQLRESACQAFSIPEGHRLPLAEPDCLSVYLKREVGKNVD